jgi:hypothetical protein
MRVSLEASLQCVCWHCREGLLLLRCTAAGTAWPAARLHVCTAALPRLHARCSCCHCCTAPAALPDHHVLAAAPRGIISAAAGRMVESPGPRQPTAHSATRRVPHLALNLRCGGPGQPARRPRRWPWSACSATAALPSLPIELCGGTWSPTGCRPVPSAVVPGGGEPVAAYERTVADGGPPLRCEAGCTVGWRQVDLPRDCPNGLLLCPTSCLWDR